MTAARMFGLIPAAGGGTRFGANEPKQYARIDGVTVLERTLRRLREGLSFDAVFVAIAADDLRYERECALGPGVEALRCGGDTRAATVRNALALMAERCEDDDWILVHDAARPCVSRDALQRLVAHLRTDPVGGLLGIPVADTLKRSDGDVDVPRVLRTEERAALWQAQTPQMFRYAILRRAFPAHAESAPTDEAQAVEALGLSPRLVHGSRANLKITYAEDLALAAAILSTQGSGAMAP